MSAPNCTIPVDVVYVDPSVAARAAFVSTNARTLRVCVSDGADLDGIDGDVVFVRHRGEATPAVLDRLEGRQRIVIADARAITDLDASAFLGRCEQILVLPLAPTVVTLAARTAARAAAHANQRGAILDLLLERDRLDAVATQRGELLHDLANLATAVTVDLELLQRSAAGTPHADEVAELIDLGRRILAVHARSRGASRSLRRDPQALPFTEVITQAGEVWRASHPESAALEVAGDPNRVVHGDRLDLVRLLVTLGDIAMGAGVPPRVSASGAPGLCLIPDGVADPDSLGFALATRIVEANQGTWRLDGSSLVCRMAADR